MDTHNSIVNGLVPWIEEMEQKSDGRLKFTYYNPNTICPQKDVYDSTVSGMIDIGTGYPGNYPGKFPLNTVLELPFIAPSAEAGI